MTSIHITIEFDVLENKYKEYDSIIDDILNQISTISSDEDVRIRED